MYSLADTPHCSHWELWILANVGLPVQSRTHTIGQLLKLTISADQPFERLLHSKICQSDYERLTAFTSIGIFCEASALQTVSLGMFTRIFLLRILQNSVCFNLQLSLTSKVNLMIDPTTVPAILTEAGKQGVLKEIYGDLLQPGVRQVGGAIEAVLGLGNTVLWPLHLLNQRARINLQANFESYREKMARVPIEHVVTPPPELAVPIVEKFPYLENEDLRELFTTLLTMASSSETNSKAHPSFANVISNLCPDEAQLLRSFIGTRAIPFCFVRYVNALGDRFTQVCDMHFRLRNGINLAFRENLSAYISNLEGLGILKIDRNTFTLDEDQYSLLTNDVKTAFANYEAPEGYPIQQINQGRIDVTDFGKMFISTCVAIVGNK